MTAVLDEGTGARGLPDRAQQGQRRTRRYPARPRHDDHRDGGREITGDQIGQRGTTERQIHQPAREPIGKPLNRRLGVLRRADCRDDLPVRGLRADPLGTKRDGSTVIDRARIDLTALRDVNRQRFSGDP